MSGEFASTNPEGKRARASGRVLLGADQYATLAVTCHVQARYSSGGDDLDPLSEQYLTAASTYALGLARALAEAGSVPTRLEVDAECQLDRSGAEPRLTALALEVRGEVHGTDQQAFEQAAHAPRLLRSAWSLPENASVQVAARLTRDVDAQVTIDTPADTSADGPAPPDAGRRVRPVRWLAVVGILAALLVYLALGTPALGMLGIFGNSAPDELDPAARASPASTRVIADGQPAASPTVQTDLVMTQLPVATATPPAVQAPRAGATAVSSPTLAPPTPLATPRPAAAPAISQLIVTQLPAASPIASPAITQLASVAGFDESFATNARRWPDDPGSTAWLTAGGYRLTPRRPAEFVALRAPLTDVLADVRVTGVFRKVAGPPGGGYGIILRDQSPAPLDGITQSGRYYVFEVGDRDGVGIWRREDDQWIEILPWTPSPAVHGQNGTNELIAVAHGTQLEFFVNGTLVANTEDATLTEGGVGVFTGGDGNDVLLTRFAVQPLS